MEFKNKECEDLNSKIATGAGGSQLLSMCNRNSISEHNKFQNWEKDQYFQRYSNKEKEDKKKRRQTGIL